MSLVHRRWKSYEANEQKRCLAALDKAPTEMHPACTCGGSRPGRLSGALVDFDESPFLISPSHDHTFQMPGTLTLTIVLLKRRSHLVFFLTFEADFSMDETCRRGRRRVEIVGSSELCVKIDSSLLTHLVKLFLFSTACQQSAMIPQESTQR
jgi:hypothetical protein